MSVDNYRLIKLTKSAPKFFLQLSAEKKFGSQACNRNLMPGLG
jgi:hypothetical protein